MKPVKSFEEYRFSLKESRKINEGILDVLKGALKLVGEFFTGTGSKFLNALVHQTKGELPHGVKIYPNKADMEVMQAQRVAFKPAPKLPESYTGADDFNPLDENAINEAKVELEHPDPNVQNIGTEKFKFLLHSQIKAGQKEREPNPILIWGAPGIGKTAIIEQVAKDYGIEMGNNRLIVVDLQTMKPEDFFLPTSSTPGAYTPQSKSARLPIEWLPVYDVKDPKGNDAANGVDGAGGVIFFDEIARCDSAVQDVCLKLCDDSRRVGNYKLGSKWVIVCAANRESDEGDSNKTYNFSSTLGNRFKQYNFVPKFEEWAEWAAVAKDKDGELVVTPEILTFLRFFSEYWHNLEPDGTDILGGKKVIFPTPRAWTKASVELKQQRETAKELGKKFTLQDTMEAVAGSVGRTPANEFISFLRMTEEIDPKDIEKVYTDPDKAPTFERLDLGKKKGFMAAILMSKSKQELTDKEIMNFTKWLVRCKDEQLGIRMLSQLKAFHPELKDSVKFNEDALTLFFDSYPNLTKEKEKLSH